MLFDAHSIRSVVPRLFEGTLPVFNLGTNSGRSCAVDLTHSLQAICISSGLPTVVDGRFKGLYITRHYGQPDSGVHTVQLELAMRGYLEEPSADLQEHNWPPPYEPAGAAGLVGTLRRVIEAAVGFGYIESRGSRSLRT